MFGLVVLFTLLVVDVDGRDGRSRRCPDISGVTSVTCLPSGHSSGGSAAGTNNSGRSAQKPKAPATKVPAAKVPAARKIPAAPPRVSLGKR